MAANLKTILPGPLHGADLDRFHLILGSTRYAMDRAFAHAEDPGDYPIPAGPNSLERVLLSSVSKLKPGVRRRMSADARDRLKEASAARVARYGEIGRRAPGDAVDTLQELKQAFATPRFRISAAKANKDPLEAFRPSKRAAQPAVAAIPTRLELFARQITCVDDTRELGKDEIALAGIRQEVRIDPTTGKSTSLRAVVDPIALGKFKSGDPPRAINRVLTSFDLANTPKLCTFDLFLAETDVLKGFSRELEEARDFIPDRLSELIYSVSGAGLVVGASALLFPGAWPAYLILLIVIAGVLLANGIYAGLRDDVFPPRQTGIPVPSPDFTFPDGALETKVETAQFSKFGGKYRLDFNWRLV